MTEQNKNAINGASSIILKGSEGQALAPLTKISNVAGLEETIFEKTDKSLYFEGNADSFSQLSADPDEENSRYPVCRITNDFIFSYPQYINEPVKRLYFERGDLCFYLAGEWRILQGKNVDEYGVKTNGLSKGQLVIGANDKGKIEKLAPGSNGDILTMKNGSPAWTVPEDSGVTAGTYGPSEDESPDAGESFSVPSFAVDAKGRVTSASTNTITLPAAYVHPTDGLDDSIGGTPVVFNPTNSSYSTMATLLRILVNEEGHVTGAKEAAFTIDLKNLGIFCKIEDESNKSIVAANPSGILDVKGALKINESDNSLHVDVDEDSGLKLDSSKAISINKGTGLYVSADHKLCADLHYTIMED